MLDRIIFYAFGLLLFFTPLFWTQYNYELFEFNKMILVYFLTIVITGVWVLKMVRERAFIFKRTPLDIPILLFLGANILSTIFSIDPHTSIWGYYSRSNGGLLSIISYSLLFFAFTANINKEKALTLLKFGLFGGLLVALYAIPEHFGVSPSCVVLRQELSADCWIQDVQARVFATLGQPNWLAAYLGMLIFPAMYFFLTAKSKKILVTCYLLLVTLYMAFTFAYSRGATLGLLAGLLVFLFTVIGVRFSVFGLKMAGFQFAGRKLIWVVLISFLVVNVLFGSALTRFKLAQLSPTSAPRVSGGVTQLENGGTESGQIRLIVWKGAVDIFRHYPIFGSGVETFAYSYYQFRPAEHNLVSEWDFLYNKAHNEFLNYLATTGIVGFGTYLFLIATFFIWAFKKITFPKVQNSDSKLLVLAILASYISYLVQNIFSFSVVMIAVFFFLFPAFAFVISESTFPLKLPKKLLIFNFSLFTFIYRRPIYTKSALMLILAATLYLLTQVLVYWKADTFFAKGTRASEDGSAGRAFNYLSDAVKLRKFDPYYRSELGYAAASAALALNAEDATLSAQLKEQAEIETSASLNISPNNVSFWRTAIRTYFELSGLDEKYNEKTIEAFDKTISLAPTDPKLYYNKAVILGELDRNDEAIEALKKAIVLKPNYRDAYLGLALFQFDKKETGEAVKNMQTVLKLIPNDPDGLKYLNDWGGQGIATSSASIKGI